MMNKPVLPDESIAIGQQAAEIAANALDELGREMIRQKALDIARQIEIYLQPRTFSSTDELKRDHVLASIAVVKIGHSGYSALHDTNAINLFHFEPEVVGTDLRVKEANYSQFLEIIERGLIRNRAAITIGPSQMGPSCANTCTARPFFQSRLPRWVW